MLHNIYDTCLLYSSKQMWRDIFSHLQFSLLATALPLLTCFWQMAHLQLWESTASDQLIGARGKSRKKPRQSCFTFFAFQKKWTPPNFTGIISCSSIFYSFTVFSYKQIIIGIINVLIIYLCCLWVKMRNRVSQVFKIDLSPLTPGFH